MLCTRCGEAPAEWVFGKDEAYCQDCWEAHCSEEWWRYIGCAMPPTLEAQLKAIFRRHEGHEKAITSNMLHWLTGARDRQLRLAIRQLITGGMPIASLNEPPYGYFLIATWQEAEYYARSLRERLIEDNKRRVDFLRAAERHMAPAEQGVLI